MTESAKLISFSTSQKGKKSSRLPHIPGCQIIFLEKKNNIIFQNYIALRYTGMPDIPILD